MSSFLVKPATRLKGEVTLSGDKSIAHRCIIVSAISSGKTTIENFPTNKDCLYTVKVFKKLGIKISLECLKHRNCAIVNVYGRGLYGLKGPKTSIFTGESGTTLRLLLGILAGQNFKVRLTAGKSLASRPMLRVTNPLKMMGAKITARRNPQTMGYEEYPPITIKGGNLTAITYEMPVASAQVKSAILLAGLYAKGITKIIEPIKTRDHTERMLKLFKAGIKPIQNTIVIRGNKELVSPQKIFVPGDISSASFFIVLAAILPNSQILVRNVSLNPSRIGVIKVLKRMGADIRVTRSAGQQVTRCEPMGYIFVKSSSLKGTVIEKAEIPSLIDELPILMVAACFAQGETVFKAVGELRVKETDRIKSMSENLIKMGAVIKVIKATKSEDIVVRGVKVLQGSQVRSFGDHRTAMSMIVAGLRAKGNTEIDDITCINKSFPDFTNLLKALVH